MVCTQETKTIQPFDIKFTENELRKGGEWHMKVMTSGMLMPGEGIQQAEQLLAQIHSVHDAVLFNSGSSALRLTFRALELKKTLCPSVTNFATAQMLLDAGSTPIFYDGGLFPSLESIKQIFNSVQGIDSLVIVHLGGIVTPDMQAIERWCQEVDIKLFIDGAHAHGCTDSDGRGFATYGYGGCLSFFRTKVVHLPEGGAWLTNDFELAKQLRMYRDQGKVQEGPDKDGLTNMVHGDSARFQEPMAGYLIAMLQNLQADNQRRREILASYHAKTAINPLLTYPMGISDGRCVAGASGYKMVVESPRRDQLKHFLNENRVETSRGIYEKPLHQQPIFQDLIIPGQSFPLAEAFANNHLCLPIWRGLSNDDLSYVLDTLHNFS